MTELLYKLDNLVEGEVIKRPSLHIKTPYVADIKIVDTEEMTLGHTASLGCCGLSDTGAHVLMSQINGKGKCKYRVFLSILHERENEIIVGINPLLAETLVENALKLNLLSRLKNIKRYRKQTKIYAEGLVDSRFDFTGIDETGIPFIMEVKNVPLADYEDMTAKDRKKMDFTGRHVNSKVAYFPDGYRKKSAEPVSPRALKHINELSLIKSMSKTRCIMCYVIQRTDVDRFQPSIIDPAYRNAFEYAINNGVEVITMVVGWNSCGEAYFVRDDLPIKIPHP